MLDNIYYCSVCGNELVMQLNSFIDEYICTNCDSIHYIEQSDNNQLNITIDVDNDFLLLQD